MLSRKLLPKISINVLPKRQLHNCIVKNEVEIYHKIIEITTVVGGIGGGCKGIYTGYKWNRRKSYVDCITNTTIDFFGNTCLGLCFGYLTGILSPILVPLFCISAPVACGVGIVKYFDKK